MWDDLKSIEWTDITLNKPVFQGEFGTLKNWRTTKTLKAASEHAAT